MITSRAYVFVRARQLENTYPGNPRDGVWGITSNRIHFGWGAPADSEWPYFTSPASFFDAEPPGVDLLAKRNRSGPYRRIRNVGDCRAALRRMERVCRREDAALADLFLQVTRRGAMDRILTASFKITADFVNTKGRSVITPAGESEVIGAHAVGLAADVEDAGAFLFANSWGAGWGEGGYALMPHEFLARYQIECWLRDTSPYRPRRSKETIQVRRWARKDEAGRDIFGLEIYHSPMDERIGWAFGVRRTGSLEVEELFVRPSFRGRGHGRRLLLELAELSRTASSPLKLWISWADAGPSSMKSVIWTCKKLGLTLQNTNHAWAAYMATPGKTDPEDILPAETPPVPAYAARPNTPEEDEQIDRAMRNHALAITPSRAELGRLRERLPVPTIEYGDEPEME